MSEICEFPLCQFPADQGSEFCLHHRKHFGPAKVKDKPKPIASMSEKRKELQKEYVKVVKEMLAENPLCEINAVGCSKIAQGLQHKVKRSSKNLLKRENLLRSCNNCNTWIENNPLEAIVMGVSVSKFKPE